MRRHTDDGHRYMCDICGKSQKYSDKYTLVHIGMSSGHVFLLDIRGHSHKTDEVNLKINLT